MRNLVPSVRARCRRAYAGPSGSWDAPEACLPSGNVLCRVAALRHFKNAFAAALAVKQPVGVLGLSELPALGEQVVDRNFSLRDEACTFRLSDFRERP